ncbi:hypothetical protein ACJXDE_13415 (plasmid) [Enterococcus faecium]|uniref:hypothetical protein n=1 Tax=Enterococcus faecium TaxID=1352 RepID=UPI0038D49389
MKKRFEIRRKSTYEATNPDLNQLNAMVEGKLESRKMAVPKSGFTYFHYGNESYLDVLEAFCAPIKYKRQNELNEQGL